MTATGKASSSLCFIAPYLHWEGRRGTTTFFSGQVQPVPWQRMVPRRSSRTRTDSQQQTWTPAGLKSHHISMPARTFWETWITLVPASQYCSCYRNMRSRRELHLAHHTGRQMKHSDGDLLEVRSWIQTQTSKLNTFRKPYAANPGSKEKPSVCSEPGATPTHGNGDGARWGRWKVSLVSRFIIISRLSS